MVSDHSSSSSSRDGPEPQREQLNFTVCHDGLSTELITLVDEIKKVAENILFHWRTFPIVLPAPLAVQHDPPSSVITGHADNLAYTANSFDGSGIGGHILGTGTGTSQTGKAKPLILRDAFVAPSFDELDAVAVDLKGDPRRLSTQHLHSIREKGLDRDIHGKRRRLNGCQLETIRRTGEFEVESLHFPGQAHRWQLSSWLQKGCEKAHETLLDDVALAASLIIITAKNRISSPIFSLSQALSSCCQGLVMLLDLAVGVPWVQAHNLEARMKEERCSYLVQELSCKDGDIDGLCCWMRQQIKRAAREKFQLSGEKQPPVPYVFTTPQGQELDLRLFNRELMKKILPILVAILEKEARGWFLHFRENVIAQLKTQGLNDHEIEKEGNRLVQEEYLRRVFTSMSSNLALIEIGENIPQLLIEQAKAVLLMHQALDEVEKIYEDGERSKREELNRTHPILSRIDTWLTEQLRIAHDSLMEKFKWRPHEHALDLCRQHHLSQHSYFLQRDLAFMKEREPVLQKELQNLKVATRVFQWRAQIWFPGNYIVRRSFQGESEVIPTILASSPTSITTPRTDPNQPVYLLEKQIVRTTSTRWPLWRWFNFVHRSWAWMCNTLFFFAIWVPLCSPISLRALLCHEPFMSDFELSQVNGTVCPSKASLTPTLTSRLHNLWRHISKSRTHFETTPDTGFIGKGVTRHMNRAWNYVMKGIVGTIFLTTLFPVLCVTLSLGSIAIAVAAPLWVPVIVILAHLVCIFLYDIDAPSSEGQWLPIVQAVVWHFFLLGIVQPIFAFVAAAIVCPLFSTAVLCFGVVRRGLRHILDTIMFHGIIKKRGRVPASDSILVSRIAGPGLHSNFYYQISCEQALGAFESRLEVDELMAYQYEMEKIIAEPLVKYSEFIHNCFGTFSGVAGRGGNYGRVEKEVRDLTLTLHEKIDRRKKDLALGLTTQVRSKIKLTTRELKLALKQGTILLEEIYPTKVLKRLIKSDGCERDSTLSIGKTLDSDIIDDYRGSLARQNILNRVLMTNNAVKHVSMLKDLQYESLESWWDAKGLTVGDYAGLCSLIFTEIFSPDFLTPMEETDTSFRMEIQNVNLARYTEMIRCIPDRPDLDEKLTVHTPRGNIHVHAPYLDLASFTPLVRHGVPTQKVEKASLAARLSLRLNPGRRLARSSRVPEKLLIPPPIPHPAHIAVIIHNREALEPIPLDAPLTLQVIRTIEDSPHVIANVTSFNMDETPDSDSQTSSLSRDAPSMYDDPSIYSRPSHSRSNTADYRQGQKSGRRSRTATLEMTSTLDRMGPLDSNSQDYNRSSTLELTPTRMAQRLTNPLRSLLESQRPFTVALNLASAEDIAPDTEDDTAEGSSDRSSGDNATIPLHALTHSTYTTAV